MGLFNRIKDKLGIGSPAEGNEATTSAPPPAPGTPSAASLRDRPTTTSNATTGVHQSDTLGAGQAAPATPTTTPGATGTASTGSVDVAGKLDQMAASHGETLNWRTSIVDLLKLLGLDSSLASRQELADELGCPADKRDDSAEMNMWLHREVLKRLAQHGGQVPPELL